MQTLFFSGASLSALALGCMPAPALAGQTQTTRSAAAPTEAEKAKAEREDKRKKAAAEERKAGSGNAADNSDVIVTGVRNSLAQARDTKRKADNILDAVDAEDIGKLPNNTVGDVIATLPGIDAFRREGEVDDIKLRGLDDIQTTVGGTPIASGSGRSASIADLPADLVQSVEVQKTRTPDQVEGAGAGTINVVLRKPSNFKSGLTVAVNTAQRYNTQSRRRNQVYTGIMNYRKMTGIGSVGIMLAATLNRNPFLDSRANNDWPIAVDPRQSVGPQILPYPTYAPRQSYTVYNGGQRTTPNYNGAVQWSDDTDDVAFEVNFSNPRFDRILNEMYLPILTSGLGGNANALPALSNITFLPNSNRMASVTVTPTSPIQAITTYTKQKEKTYLYKLTGSHREDRFLATTEVSVAGSNLQNRNFTLRNRFVTRPTYDVEFANDDFGYPQMNVKLRDINMLDPNEYRFFSVIDRQSASRNRAIATRADLTLFSDGGILETLKFGLRFTSSRIRSRSGDRTADGYQLTAAQMPGAFSQLSPIAQGFSGTGVQNQLQWLAFGNGDAAFEDFGKLRELVSVRFPAFATEDVTPLRSSLSDRREQSVAGYGNVKLRARLLFPIEVNIGARLSNWMTVANSFKQTRIGTISIYSPIVKRSNTVQLEPTVSGRVNFTDNFRLGASYNIGIQRPTVGQLSPFVNLSASPISGGNPDLTPVKIKKLDGILEWFPGKLGTFTINPFYWKRDGTITSFTVLEDIDGLPVPVSRPYNAGKGYKRGFEAQAQTFFTFLPGLLKNFGVLANYTYTETEVDYTAVLGATNSPPAKLPELGVPKNYYNITGLFERAGLSARVSYSFQGRMLDNRATANSSPAQFSSYFIPRQWVDVAVNYTIPNGPLKNVGVSIQAQNLFGMARRTFYGYPDLPRDTWYNARTFGGAIRYKF